MSTIDYSNLLMLAGTLSFIVISCIGAGFIIWQKTTGQKTIPTHSISYFLGQVAFSLVSIIISTLFSYPVNLVLIILITIPAFFYGTFVLKPSLFKLRHLLVQKGTKTRWVKVMLFSFLLFFLSINFTHSFLLQTGWDEIVYHEPVVREISRGSVRYPLLKDSPFVNFYAPFTELYGNFPYSSEAYASVGYLISGQPSVTSLLYFINFVAFLLFVCWALKDLFKAEPATRLVILILLSTSYNIVLLLTTSYIDINVAIYQFVAIILVLWGINKHKLSIIVPSMVAVGYSLGMKYTSFLFLPFYLALLLIELHNKGSFREARKYIQVGFLLMVLAGGYWYAKNLVLYQNPIYPLIFGHKGLSKEMYDLIVDTQTSLRFSRNFTGLWQAIRTNFFKEPIVILSFILTGLSSIFNSKSKSGQVKQSKYLLMMVLFLYLFNFYFANQIFRYILVVPMILYLLFSQYLKVSKLFGILIVVFVITSIWRNPSLRDVWQSRVADIVLVSTGNYEGFYTKNLGCAWSATSIIRENSAEGARAINLWDPYAAVFYKDENIFYNFNEIGNIEDFGLPDDAQFYYINKSYRKGFLSKPDFHRNLQLGKRRAIEDSLIKGKTPFYQSGNCLLYKLN